MVKRNKNIWKGNWKFRMTYTSKCQTLTDPDNGWSSTSKVRGQESQAELDSEERDYICTSVDSALVTFPD